MPVPLCPMCGRGVDPGSEMCGCCGQRLILHPHSGATLHLTKWIIGIAIVIGLGIILVASFDSYRVRDVITLTAAAVRDSSNGVVVKGTTNLPDGTKLGIELMSDGKPGAQDLDVYVTSGSFQSAGFRNGDTPVQPGIQTVHIFTYFTTSWQSQKILDIVGSGGSNLKTSPVIHVEDPQLIDGDKILNYSLDLTIPPLVGNSAYSSDEATAIETVKNAVLVVNGSLSSMNVEDGFRWYCNSPGIYTGDGWSAKQTANGTYYVTLDYINTINDVRVRDKALWEVNLSTKEVSYGNENAKAFSWVPNY